MWHSNMQQPQNWNKYAYVLNNPAVLVDLDGELWMKINDHQVQWVDKCPKDKECFEIMVFYD